MEIPTTHRSVPLLSLSLALAGCALSTAGCRDHVDSLGHRLGDHDVLAGRSAADGGPGLTDDDLRRGFFVADDASVGPLQDTLRSSLSLSIDVFGRATASIPAGERVVFNPARGYPGDGTYYVRRGAGSGAVGVGGVGNEYRALCRAQILGNLLPPSSGSTACQLFDLSSITPFIEGLTLDLRSSEITVSWVAPRTDLGEYPDRPVLAFRLPFDADTDPKDFVPIDPDFSADLVFRVQVVPDGASGRRAFTSYRNRTASIGDLWYSDAGASILVRGIADNVIAGDFHDEIASAMQRVASRAANLLGNLLRTPPLDRLGGHSSPAVWRSWCDAHFSGACPVPAGVLDELAAYSVANLASAELVLPPTADYPLSAVLSPVSSDGTWTNGFIAALNSGAEIARMTHSRGFFRAICDDPAATYCTDDPGADGCATCDFCRTPPPGTEAVCDFSLDHNLVFLPGDDAPRIPRSPNIAKLMDMAPNLGVELTRVFSGPVDAYEEETGDAMRYTDIVQCPNPVRPEACPAGATGAVFVLANDPDGDGIPIPDDNCPALATSDTRDRDGDGIGDACDACPSHPSTSTADQDGDGIPDACDCDIDGDGCNNEDAVMPVDGATCMVNGDVWDERPRTPGGDDDLDGDDKIDDCDSDDDGDGVPDAIDNCPRVYNPGQEDSNGDGIGDACDRLCPYPGASGCRRFDELELPEGIWTLIPHWEPGPDCLVDGPGCWIWWLRGEDELELVGDLVSLGSIDAAALGIERLDGPIAFIPDVDGDGVDDLLVGAPNADRIDGNDIHPQAGAVIAIGSLSGEEVWRLSPLDADAGFGASIARVGDAVWVGAPGAVDVRGRMTGAIVRIDAGSEQGREVREVRYGQNPGQEFGTSLTVVPGTEPGAAAEALVVGGVFPDGFPRFDILTPDGVPAKRGKLKVTGGQARVVGIDARMIGRPAFLVAMPDAAGGAGVLALFDLRGSRRWTIEGEAGERLGASMTGALAIGQAYEVVVGAPGAAKGAGALYRVGKKGALVPLVKGEPGDHLGAFLASPGDLDRDGVRDLAIGAPGAVIDPQGVPGGTMVIELPDWR